MLILFLQVSIVFSQREYTAIFADYTLWKYKGFYNLGIEYQSNKTGFCYHAKAGFGSMGKGLYERTRYKTDGAGNKSLADLSYPDSEFMIEYRNEHGIDEVHKLFSRLRGYSLNIGIKMAVNTPSKIITPHFGFDLSAAHITDNLEVTFYRIWNNQSFVASTKYSFLSFGIGTRCGATFNAEKHWLIRLDIGLVYYIPYHYNLYSSGGSESKFNAQYDGNSVFEAVQPETRLSIGYKF